MDTAGEQMSELGDQTEKISQRAEEKIKERILQKELNDIENKSVRSG